MEHPGKLSDGKKAESRVLRMVAEVTVGVAAVISLGLLLWAGRTNKHVWLTILFILWVLAPFIGVIGVSRFAKRWPFHSRAVIYAVMTIVALASMVVYINDVIHPRESQPAFVFVIVPPTLFLFIAIGFFIAAYRSRRGVVKNTIEGGK